MAKLLSPPQRFFGIYPAAVGGLALVHLSLWTLLFFPMLIFMAVQAYRHAQQPSRRRLALLCAALAIGMNVSYQAMAGAIPAVRGKHFDAEPLALDRWLLGETPAVCLQQYARPWLTDLMSGCYILLMSMLGVSLARYFFRERHLLGEFYTGLFAVYGLGFLDYLAVAAAGPWLAYPQLFNVELAGSTITAIDHNMAVQGSNKVDVWPSLHVAVTLYPLGFARRRHRLDFWLLLLPVAGLWLSTFYLRYHYFVDVLCGVVLAGFGLLEARRHPTFPAYEKDNNDSVA